MLSIWLVPQEPELSQLRLSINGIARIAGGPTFEPHVTILADVPLSPSEIVERSGSQTRRLPGFELTASEVGTGTSYFKSLFLQIDPSDVLHDLRRLTLSHLPSESVEEAFEPHVSLAYGNLPRGRRSEIIEIATSMTPMQLRFNDVLIVQAARSLSVSAWSCLEVIRLGRESRG